MKPKKELVRVVKKQDGNAVVDLTGKQAGRGAYLCMDARCVEIARKQKRLERGLDNANCAAAYEELRLLAGAGESMGSSAERSVAKQPMERSVVKPPIAQRADGTEIDSKRVYGSIGLAMKKGAVASGSDACESAARDGQASLIILASDASANIKHRFVRIAASHGIDCIEIGEKAELGRHIGKSERSALAILDRRLAQSIVHAFTRQAGNSATATDA
jgi:predicted RNA-binding protein YlxR (DUF448 family)/ribosomal protein L7Ae-like RNA K-turn-binding protein